MGSLVDTRIDKDGHLAAGCGLVGRRLLLGFRLPETLETGAVLGVS